MMSAKVLATNDVVDADLMSGTVKWTPMKRLWSVYLINETHRVKGPLDGRLD